jgi:DNA polymerase III alpha subunit (gram-positive type)
MPYLLDVTPVDFKSRPLLFIDLEMTGLDVGRHEIIEVAALRVSQPKFEIENSYYTKIFPEHIGTGDPQSLKVVNYSPESWKNALPLRQVLEELSRFAPDSILTGWAVQNEWDFLNSALEKEHLPYFYTHRLLEVSTLAYARFYKDSSVRFLSLSNIAKVLGIHIETHRPDSDIRATYEIFRKLINQNPASKK